MTKHLDGFVRIDKNGTFYISGGTMELMNLKDGDGVMVSLCRRKNCVFLYREKEEAFTVRLNKSGMTFNSLESSILVREFFEWENSSPLRLSARKDGEKIRLVTKSE